MIVGFFSPLPPQRTGVASYSAALLQALQRRFDVRKGKDGDINLYHLGNNQLHRSIYRRALKRPGVLVLHDAMLHHFVLGSLNRDEYIDEFMFNYGDWTREQASELWRNRARSAGDNLYYQYPMLKRVLSRALAVIVHNPAAVRIVRAHNDEVRIFEIPHLWDPVALPHPSLSLRFRQNLQCHSHLFGILGHLRESKRLLPTLRIFKQHSDWHLMLAGDIASSSLRKAVEHSSAPNVHRIGYMDNKQYWTVACALDACINLRSPPAGETSGVSVGLMGAAKPVIMTDAQENERYPDDVCIKIPPGLSEAAGLEAALDWSSVNRSKLLEIGANAAAYIRKFHSLSRVADLYEHALTVH